MAEIEHPPSTKLAGFNSAVERDRIYPAQMEFMNQWETNGEVSELPLVILALGLGCGPMVLAPFWEYWGRSPV